MNDLKTKIEKLNSSHQIILFDGSCLFCNWSVHFVLKKDKRKRFLFASLQSEIAKEYLAYKPESLQNIDSIILIRNGNIYTKSSAALLIAKQLKSITSLLYLFIVIPKFLRDFVYDFVARNRKSILKNTSCKIPTEEEKKRFIS